MVAGCAVSVAPATLLATPIVARLLFRALTNEAGAIPSAIIELLTFAAPGAARDATVKTTTAPLEVCERWRRELSASVMLLIEIALAATPNWAAAVEVNAVRTTGTLKVEALMPCKTIVATTRYGAGGG